MLSRCTEYIWEYARVPLPCCGEPGGTRPHMHTHGMCAHLCACVYVIVYRNGFAWLSLSDRNALVRKYDVSTPPDPAICGALMGWRQIPVSGPPPHNMYTIPWTYPSQPICCLALSSQEGLQQSQGAGGQLVRGLIRDLGTPRGWEAEGSHEVDRSRSCLS